jgi:hypothetical protein
MVRLRVHTMGDVSHTLWLPMSDYCLVGEKKGYLSVAKR